MERLLPSAVAWFSFEDYAELELVVRVVKELKIKELRTAFSWADWERNDGPQWFDAFVGRLYTERISIVPCLFYTPPQKARAKPGMEPKSSFPPERLEDFAGFTREIIMRYGHTFEWIQFWNESNWDVYWNWEMDPEWKLFGEMTAGAAAVAKNAKKKIVLGGLAPYEEKWLDRMHEYGVLQQGDALGIHAFPGTWDAEEKPRRVGRPWAGFVKEVDDVRAKLSSLGSHAEIWITETGYSTFGEGAELAERERNQIRFWNALLAVPADRVFWHALIDQKPDTPTDNELNSALVRDDKAYHFGVVDAQGRPKPLYRHWRDMLMDPSSANDRLEGVL